MLQVGLIITNGAVSLKIKTLGMHAGVSVHAKYGGLFAIRGVIVFKVILAPNVPRKEPEDVVQGDEKRVELLEKFNFHWKDYITGKVENLHSM